MIIKKTHFHKSHISNPIAGFLNLNFTSQNIYGSGADHIIFLRTELFEGEIEFPFRTAQAFNEICLGICEFGTSTIILP